MSDDDDYGIPMDKLIDPNDDFDSDPFVEMDAKNRPDLPDGIGLSYKDIALLMAMKHKSVAEADEPIMIMVSVCNAFLSETEKLHQRHNEALSTIIAGKTQEYISGVKKTTDAFTQTLADASVEGVRQIFKEHAASLQAHQGNTRWCAFIVAISALANIAVLALR